MQTKSADIAIVGMACMFPKANDLRTYWENIFKRVDAVTEVPAERWSPDDFFDEDRFTPDKVYSKWGGFLGKVLFDPVKWRIPPASLVSIEPIQLLSLEVASQAMIDAGFDKRPFPKEKTGVLFATAGSHELGSGYAFRTMMRHYLPKVDWLDDATRDKLFETLEEKLPEWTEDSFPGFLLNVVAGRIAREFDLNGPNYVVDAACAASLAALHAAIEQLRTGTSDMMLVGAADATNNPFCFMSFSKTHALSPTGHSRPFDDAGDGIALGEGIAVIVIKRLADAERDGDKIYSVIKGIGSSSDGKNKSLTAPHPPGQMKAVRRAYQDAQISPASVSLIEAHGTGTVVGDSSEVTTLTEVFKEHSAALRFAGVGSVKSMIGHTKTVAGIASIIKTSLALSQRVLPPTIGVDTPTRKVDFNHSPFYINTETRPWLTDAGNHPRRAGVSAFGFGGTNFHVVMEEYASDKPNRLQRDLTPRPVEVFLFCRPTRTEVQSLAQSLIEQLERAAPARLDRLAAAWNRQESKSNPKEMGARLGIVAGTSADLLKSLKRAVTLLAEPKSSFTDPAGIYFAETPVTEQKSVCFLFPGQGSQSVNMLRELVNGCSWGTELISQANRVLADFFPQPISHYLYPTPAFSDSERKRQFAELSDTRIAQPALGVVEIFALELLKNYGLQAGAVAGHSYGEHVALYAAGCLTQDELLSLSAMRGHVCAEVAKTTPGGMAAVRADADTTRMALADINSTVTLANLNAPDQTIVAGLDADIDEAVEKLNKAGIKTTRIPVSAPFHTALLAAGAEAMAHHFAKASFAPAKIPVYSNTTGKAHSDRPEEIRDLLTRHFSEPVLFEQEVREMYRDGIRVFVEVGPGKVLTNLVARILKDEPVHCLALDAAGREGFSQFGHLLAQSASLGLAVDLAPWFADRELGELSVAEVIEEAYLQVNPKSSQWWIGPAKAEPITPLPVRKGSSADALRAKFGMKGTTTKAAGPKAKVQPAPTTDLTAAKGVDANGTSAHTSSPAVEKVDFKSEVVPTVLPPSTTTPIYSAAAVAPRSVTSIYREKEVSLPGVSAVGAGTFVPSGSNAVNNSAVEMYAQFQTTTRMMLDLQVSQQRVLERFLDMQDRLLAACLNGSALAGPAAIAPAAMAYIAPPVAQAPVAPAPIMQAPAASPAAPRALAPVSVPVVKPPISVPAVQAPAPVARPAAVPAAAVKPAAAPVAPAAKKVAPAEEKVAAKPAAAPVSSNGEGPPSTEVFKQDLLQIVSERTGYPVDMLDIELPLEAGLGIDSIKTVEIFSNLKDYHPYFSDENQDEEELLTAFTKLKTLKDIIDSYEERRQNYLGAGGVASKAAASEGSVERYSLTAAAGEEGGVKKNFLASN